MNIFFLPPTEEGLWAIWAEFADYWFAKEYGCNLPEELIIVSACKDLNTCTFNTSRDTRLNEICRAWYQIHNSAPETQLQAWRVIHEFGHKIAPNLSVYQLRDSKIPCLFWLFPSTTLSRHRHGWLISYLEFLAFGTSRMVVDFFMQQGFSTRSSISLCRCFRRW